MRGRPTRVDAHLPTVDASFRTYLQWRNCPLQCIGSDHAIKWYHSLSRFGRTRCRRAVQVLPCQLCHHVFAISDLAQKVVTICLCDEGTWFPWVINNRLRHWLRYSQTTVTFPADKGVATDQTIDKVRRWWAAEPLTKYSVRMGKCAGCRICH